MKILCSPNTNDVENYIFDQYHSGDKILHIVPTMILFTRRKNLYKRIFNNSVDFQNKNDRQVSEILISKNIYLFEFQRFLEYIVRHSEIQVLSNNEAVILLERIMDKTPAVSNDAWKSLVFDIYNAFKYFSLSGITADQLRLFSKTESWIELIQLYDIYINELRSSNLYDFGLAAHELIEKGDRYIFDRVFFDGAFLPIQPIMHQLIKKLNENMNPITFFIPFDPTNSESIAFQVLKRTYETYVPITEWISINEQVQDLNVVEKLSRSIFSENKILLDDRSVMFLEYGTAEEELEDLVAQAVSLVKWGIANQNKIAIITPNSKKLRPVIREMIELQNVKAETPERPLIQLPFGKLLYLLYQIHTDQRIRIFETDGHYVDVDMVSDLLETGQINGTKDLIPIFVKLKAFFEDCYIFQNWYDKVDTLIQAQKEISEKYSHHPLYTVDREELVNFKNFLIYIENLSKKLIHENEMTFNQHLEYALDVLTSEERICYPGNDIVKRILEIRDSLEKEENLVIDVREFARQIHAIFTDYYREHTENEEDITKLTTTGLNNVEYQEYDYIFLAQFTQNTYPEKRVYKWPMSLELEYFILKNFTNLALESPDDLRRYYLDRSLYHLFIVLNSTRKKLIISYPKMMEGIEQTPSHYIHDIAAVFNIKEDSNSRIEDVLKKYGLLINPRKDQPINLKVGVPSRMRLELAENESVTIEELAIFEYCERRFYYEKNHPEEKHYNGHLQLELYATSCLYEESIKTVVEQYPEIGKYNERVIIHRLDEIIDDSKKKIEELFPIGQRYWEDIILRTRFHILNLISRVLSSTDHKIAEWSLEKGQWVTKKIGGFTFLGKRELRVKYPTITHYYSITNLKDMLSFSVNTKDEDIRSYLAYVKKLYNDLQRGFCYEKPEIEQILKQYAERIRHSSFDKNPGGHCQYCPFYYFCMEKEIHMYESYR